MASAPAENYAELHHEPFNVPIPSSTTKFESATSAKRRKRRPPRSKTIAKLVEWQPKSFMPAESSSVPVETSSSSRPRLPFIKTMPNMNNILFKSTKNTTDPDSTLPDTGTTTQSSDAASIPGSSREIRKQSSRKVTEETNISKAPSAPRGATWISAPRNRKKSSVLQHESGDGQIESSSVHERVQTLFKRRNSLRVPVSDSLSCRRIAYGEHAVRLKAKILAVNPSLALLPAKAEVVGFGTDFIRYGMNTMRAELLDMNMMMCALNEHRLALSHSHIETFFSWFSYFLAYFDRYVELEEFVIIKTIEDRLGPTRGEMSFAKRSMSRGLLQKAMHDLAECENQFLRNLPAGEKLSVLADWVKVVTDLGEKYCEKFLRVFGPLLDENFSRTHIERLHLETLRHILTQNGGVAEDADFIVMYTRWKNVKDLNRWKWRYLYPTTRALVPFKGWEEDVFDDHFKIAAEFADELYEENTKERQNTADESEWIETFARAKIGMAKWKKSSTRDFPSPRSIGAAFENQ